MQRQDYLCELWDKPTIVLGKYQETLGLGDGGGDRPCFDHAYFLFVGYYTLGRNSVPQLCDLSAEELTFWGFEFKFGLFQLLEHSLQSHKMADWIFWEDYYITEVYDAPIEIEVSKVGFH